MRKCVFLLCLLSAWAIQSVFALDYYEKEQVFRSYIAEYLELAKRNAAEYGIPVSICLAQAMHESAAGRSTLAVQANNHFGIKALDTIRWRGEIYYIKDDDLDPATGELKESPFRMYTSAEESYADYAQFLKGNTRYASLFKIPRTDYSAWAKGLQKAGYATSPDYASNLIKTIEQYGLHQYDTSQAFLDTNEYVQVSPAQIAPPEPMPEEMARKMAPPASAPSCPMPGQRLAPMRAKATFLPIQLR